MGNSVDVVIPIYKAGNDFVKMLEKLYKQSKRPEHIYLLQTIESKDEKLFDKEKCTLWDLNPRVRPYSRT